MGLRIKAKDLREHDRKKLEEIIPLPSPFVLYVDPTNICNFRCKFCPTSDEQLLANVGRTKASMNLALFKKVIDDASQFPSRLKLLSLYKDGEPLLNRDFPEMVRYAKKKGVAERIWTKTNGSLLNPRLNTQIIDAGLDMIHISIEHISSKGYAQIADVSIDYNLLRKNIAHLFSVRGGCKIYIKIANSGLSEADISQFYSDFQDVCDFIAVENLMGWSYSDIKDFTLGIGPASYDGLPLVDKKVCAYPFYVLAVNSDGTVSVCGNDWSQTAVVGNVKTSSLQEIWSSDSLYQLRTAHLSGKRSGYKACGDCYYLRIVPDNIDDYADAIAKKIRDQRRVRVDQA